jgi:hypothetical protein
MQISNRVFLIPEKKYLFLSMNSTMLTDEEATLYDRQIRLWGADAQLK